MYQVKISYSPNILTLSFSLTHKIFKTKTFAKKKTLRHADVVIVLIELTQLFRFAYTFNRFSMDLTIFFRICVCDLVFATGNLVDWFRASDIILSFAGYLFKISLRFGSLCIWFFVVSFCFHNNIYIVEINVCVCVCWSESAVWSTWFPHATFLTNLLSISIQTKKYGPTNSLIFVNNGNVHLGHTRAADK